MNYLRFGWWKDFTEFFFLFLKRRRQRIQSPSGVFFGVMAFATFFGQFFLMRCFFFCSPQALQFKKPQHKCNAESTIDCASFNPFIFQGLRFSMFFSQITFLPKAQPLVGDVGSGLTEWCEKERRALQVQSLIKMKGFSHECQNSITRWEWGRVCLIDVGVDHISGFGVS